MHSCDLRFLLFGLPSFTVESWNLREKKEEKKKERKKKGDSMIVVFLIYMC